jgi:hypothetical protein
MSDELAPVNMTLACDTRLALILFDALHPLVVDGTLDAESATKIITSAVRIAAVQD